MFHEIPVSGRMSCRQFVFRDQFGFAVCEAIWIQDVMPGEAQRESADIRPLEYGAENIRIEIDPIGSEPDPIPVALADQQTIGPCDQALKDRSAG